MKVYIAGHKGLVGSSLVRTLPRDCELVVATRNELDLANHFEVEKFIKYHRPDIVIVAAARVGGILANSSEQRAFLTENLEIQHSLISGSANIGVANLIFLGSSCIYPRLAPQPISENSLMTGPLEPTNEGYAIAKIAGIRLCKAIYEELGLNYFSLMPTNLFGPNDNFDLKTSHVPAAFIRKFHDAKLRNLPYVSIWGTGKPLREFMYSEDFASACWFLLNANQGGEIINVGSGHEMSILEFARLVARVVGFEGDIEFDKSKPDGTPRKIMDSSKINGLGWKASVVLEEGLRQTYEWYLRALEKGEVRGIKA